MNNSHTTHHAYQNPRVAEILALATGLSESDFADLATVAVDQSRRASDPADRHLLTALSRLWHAADVRERGVEVVDTAWLGDGECVVTWAFSYENGGGAPTTFCCTYENADDGAQGDAPDEILERVDPMMRDRAHDTNLDARDRALERGDVHDYTGGAW